ncbi:uncharacterized protein LOC121853819 [Homarus americanus]|uniref:uncharacterized protein LOC121853819 n=1 Tax=Homarus americanus TaxID=6706 RepID=UPI001C453B1D|nr:uncharacterized protein LOC121853819 [Homarus americanus]
MGVSDHDGVQLSSFIYSKTQPHTWTRTFRLYPEIWYHLCHTVHDDDVDIHTVYWQGEKFTSGPVEGTPGLPLNGTLIIGQEQDLLARGFDKYQVLHGDYAQLNVWDRALNTSEVADLANCRTPGRGNIFNMDTANWEVFGDVQETLVDLQYFCRSEPFYDILPEERSFRPTQELCELLNTTMPVPQSHEDSTSILQELAPFLNVCSAGSTWKVWLGISDELQEGVYLNVNTGRPITFQDFFPPYPIGGKLNSCVILMEDGTWVDNKCQLQRCGACYFEREDFLYLRGLCFEEERRAHFRMSGYFAGRPVLRGYFSMSVIWDSSQNRWLLYDTDKNSTLATSESQDVAGYPLGVKTWIAAAPLCGTPVGSQLNLSFSSCSKEQYMCNSGSCISHEKRCNLRYDCNDGSDENDCGAVKTGSGYQQHVPPRGPNDTNLIVISTVNITRITHVDNIRMTIGVEFTMSLTWRDDRLTFRNLNPRMETTITKADLGLIWRPQYQISPLEGGQVSLLDDFAEVPSANRAIIPDFNIVNRELGYPGDSHDIITTERYTAVLTCDFDLYIYPFDIQVCSINVDMPREYDGSVEFSKECWRASFTGSEDLSQYKVKNIAIDPRSGKDKMTVNFELHRLQGVILLSTFVPSVMLLMVSWATLFIRMELLNVRAVMSLTALLVLYTLFTNLSRTMPNTSAIKLIDVWFFFIIMLIFLNIMVHIFIERIAYFLPNGLIHGTKFGNLAQIGLDKTTEKVISVIRFYFVPAAFFTFNIIFWALIFTY